MTRRATFTSAQIARAAKVAEAHPGVVIVLDFPNGTRARIVAPNAGAVQGLRLADSAEDECDRLFGVTR